MSEEQRGVQELARELPWRRRRRIVRELATHLEECEIQLQRQGLTEREAAKEAWRRFGQASEVIDGFADTYRPSGRTRLVLAAGLAGGMLLGVYGRSGSFANANSTHRTVSHSTVSRHGSVTATAKH